MNYTEQLQLLWEQMRISLRNKVKEFGTQSDVGFKTIKIGNFNCGSDLGGNGGVLTEIGENDIFDNDGYVYSYGTLDYEQLAELADYVNEFFAQKQ